MSGRVEATAAEVMASGVAMPVVVCGRNERLRSRLNRAGVPALGRVTDVPLLMRSVDVLVENAGGPMAIEGMTTGLPVATYRPIPGHGMVSAATLDKAGVNTWTHSHRDLGPMLVRLLGTAERSAAAPMLRNDPADIVTHLATPSGEAGPPPTPRSRGWRAVNVYGSRSVIGAHETARDRAAACRACSA